MAQIKNLQVYSVQIQKQNMYPPSSIIFSFKQVFLTICSIVNSSHQKTNRCPARRTQTRGGIKLLQVADPSSPRILPTEAAILTDATIVALKLLMEWDHTLFIGHPTRFFSHPAARSSRRCPDGKTKTRFLPNEGNCYPGPAISYLMISPPIFLGVLLTCTASRCCVQSK